MPFYNIHLLLYRVLLQCKRNNCLENLLNYSFIRGVVCVFILNLCAAHELLLVITEAGICERHLVNSERTFKNRNEKIILLQNGRRALNRSITVNTLATSEHDRSKTSEH